MHHRHRRYLIEQLVIAAILNALIDAFFVWLIFGSRDRIELWGMTGLSFDLVPTTFMITLMTAVALTIATRKAVVAGKLPQAIGSHPALPANPFLRGLVLALAATLAIVPATLLLLWLLWNGAWAYGSVMIFKIAFGVGLGFVVTPVVVGLALLDEPAQPRPAV